MDRESATLDLDPDNLSVDDLPVDGGAFPVLLPGGGEVASPVVVRIAGLPAAVLRDLRFDASFSLAGSVVELRRQLNAEAQALSDDLFRAVGQCPPGVRKAALVGLRRAVFQLRPPNAREWNEHVAGLLPADVAARVGDWTAMLDRYRRLGAELPVVLAEESAAKQEVMREIAERPWFQRALSLASPALFGETAKWLADGAHVPRRGSLVRLAKYAARAAAKTSPYSTFTVLGWADWSAAGPSVWFGDRPAAGVLELSGFLHTRLRDALRDDPRLVASLPLRLNPSATHVDGTVKFLGPPPRESIVSVPAVPMVLECLRILGGGTSLHRADLRAALGAGDPGIDRFIDKLTDAGLLEHPLATAELSADPFGELAAWLTGSDVADLRAAVDAVRSQLRHPAPLHDTAGQVGHLRALGAAVDELGARAGLPVRQLADQGMDLWHENAVFTEPVGALSAAAWLPPLADLDVVRRVLAALDPALPLRVALGAYCGDRFGPGSRMPYLTVYESIARDLARPAAPGEGSEADEIVDRLSTDGSTAPPSLRDSRLARLRELARIRQDLRETALPAADPDGVVRADPAVLALLAGTWPRWIAVPDSVAWYLQVVPDCDPLRLVVNAAHGGRGRGRSRALHLIRAAGGKAPYEGPALAGVPVAAEIGGLFSFAPNARLASTQYEIDYPFTVSGRPTGQRLALRDLMIGHDPATGMVSLFGPGVTGPIKALHLGMMADLLLPPAARLLTTAFGAGYLVPANVPLFTPAPPASVAQTVVRSARVEIGQVVVRRARWVVPTAQVPAQDKGELDAGYLLRIVEWLQANDIPSRCFVRMNELSTMDTPRSERRFTKSRKPVYVDFANWYLVQAFRRMLTDAGQLIVFEEALPSPEQALGAERGPAGVTEFIVEISAPAAGSG